MKRVVCWIGDRVLPVLSATALTGFVVAATISVKTDVEIPTITTVGDAVATMHPSASAGAGTSEGVVELVIPTPTATPFPDEPPVHFPPTPTPTLEPTVTPVIEAESSGGSHKLDTTANITAYFPNGNVAYKSSVSQNELTLGDGAVVEDTSTPTPEPVEEATILSFVQDRLNVERVKCAVEGGYRDSECRGRVMSMRDAYYSALELAAKGADG